MRRLRVVSLILALVVLPAASCLLPAGRAQADTTNFSPGTANLHVLTFPLNRQYSSTTANVVRFKMPWPVTLLTVGATARASSGTTPTLTVDVLEAGTTVLSAPISITAGTVSEGTITDANIADEAVITVSLTIGGGTPTWDDITIVLVVARK